jgi:hypothetical protein
MGATLARHGANLRSIFHRLRRWPSSSLCATASHLLHDCSLQHRQPRRVDTQEGSAAAQHVQRYGALLLERTESRRPAVATDARAASQPRAVNAHTTTLFLSTDFTSKMELCRGGPAAVSAATAASIRLATSEIGDSTV